MTLLTAVRPYHRLSDVLREDVDAALAGFRAYLAQRVRPKVTVPKSATVSPSPETIAAGRAKIMRGCLKGGGNTILVFDELCAYGPLTRGDLTERLGCHRRHAAQADTAAEQAQGERD